MPVELCLTCHKVEDLLHVGFKLCEALMQLLMTLIRNLLGQNRYDLVSLGNVN